MQTRWIESSHSYENWHWDNRGFLGTFCEIKEEIKEEIEMEWNERKFLSGEKVLNTASEATSIEVVGDQRTRTEAQNANETVILVANLSVRTRFVEVSFQLFFFFLIKN